MEQAYQNFNAGKYKQALNNLTGNPSNHESYEPNLAITEYLANRCQQSALNCLRRLNDLLARRAKREQTNTDPQTHAIVKFNIAVLLLLQGRRDSALLLLQEIYKQRDCFIEFMQNRLFLLLLELQTYARNWVEVLALQRYYLLRPLEQRGQAQQWVSVVWHQHGKTFTVARQQFALLSRIYSRQALLQLGVRAVALGGLQEQQKLKQQLLARARRRKNVVNKYYELNIVLICRFAEAHRELFARNFQKCLSLMNLNTIAEEFEQMPTTKIVTNIISAFVTSNAGLVHFHYGMAAAALGYFGRAKALLAKACTGVEDRDLHLFSLNYGSFIEAMSLNQGLALLALRSKESFAYFQSMRKSNQMSRSYRFWYRMAQSALTYYHDPKTPNEQRRALLTTALAALNNALLCLDQLKVPTVQELRNLTRWAGLPEEEVEAVVMKMRSEAQQFRHSTLTLMCYVGLGLGLWRRVVRVGRALLQDRKLDARNRMNVLHYLLEAEEALGKQAAGLRVYLDQLQGEVAQQAGTTEVLYVGREGQTVQNTDYESLFSHQVMRASLASGNFPEAMKYCEYIRQKHPASLSQSMREMVTYMHRIYHFERKFVFPYLKPS